VTDAMLQIQNSGKVYADHLNQISSAGVPIFSGLASHFNTNIANVREMVQAGKVGIDDVMSVIKNAEGDTFKSMLAASDKTAKTFANQWELAKDNITTTVGSALVPVLGAITPYIPIIGKAIEGLVGGLARVATQWIPKIGEFITGLVNGSGAVGGFGAKLSAVLGTIGSILGPVLSTVWTLAKALLDAFRQLWPSIQTLVSGIVSVLVPGLQSVWQIISTQVVPAFRGLIAAIAPLVAWLVDKLAPIVTTVFGVVVKVVKSAL